MRYRESGSEAGIMLGNKYAYAVGSESCLFG